MIKRIFKFWAAMLALICASVASASTYECAGTIDFVSVSPSGVVTVYSQSSGLHVFYPCQLGTTAGGVSVDVCKGILSLLLEAKATGAQVAWGFADSVGCNRSSYNGGNWYWLNDGTSVWYYGPQIDTVPGAVRSLSACTFRASAHVQIARQRSLRITATKT